MDFAAFILDSNLFVKNLYSFVLVHYQIITFSGCSASIAVKISIFDWTIGFYSIAQTQLP